MLKHFEAFKKHAVIAGLRDARIEKPEELLKRLPKVKESDVEIQLFDAQFIVGWQHLYFAILNALTAFSNGRNISKSLAIETILYASAQHQIRKALENLGIKSSTSRIALIILGENPVSLKSTLKTIQRLVNAKRDDRVLELTNEKIQSVREIFEISDLELQSVMGKSDLKKALINIIIERMAILATQI